MTAIPTTLTNEDLRSDTFENIKLAALATLDKSGQSANLIEGGIDVAGDLAAFCIKTPVYLATSLLPHAAAVAINGTTDSIANAADAVATSVAKGVLNTATFGAPSWIQTARQYVALNGSVDPEQIEGIIKKFRLRADMSETAAERIISRVENYYKDKLGSLGGTVYTPTSEARESLKKDLSSRLLGLMEKDLSPKEMSKELKAITSAVYEGFDVKRMASRSLLYTGFGIAAYTGVLSAGMDYVSAKLSAFDGWIYDSTIGALKNYIHETIGYYMQQIKDIITYPFRAVGEAVGNAAQKAADIVTSNIPASVPAPTPAETLQTAISEALPESIKNIPVPQFATPELTIPGAPSLPGFAAPTPTTGAPYITGVNAGGGAISGVAEQVTAPFRAAQQLGNTVSSGFSAVKGAYNFARGLFSLGAH